MVEIYPLSEQTLDDKEEEEIIDIQVCSHCNRAPCWQGIFPCGRFKTASTIYRERKELEKMALEIQVIGKQIRNLKENNHEKAMPIL